MLDVDRPADLDGHIGQPLGEGEWLTVTQAMIDQFADATGDHQWIHVDVERAARELPGGKTIAHGYLTLSLIPRLGQSILRIRNRSRAVNYGANRIRFTAPVPAGARIRARQTLRACDPIEGGRRLTIETTIEIEHHPRPALIAETITQAFD